MKRFNVARIIGLVGAFVGLAGTLIGNYGDHLDLEQVVEEKLNERLGEKENEEV
jgi:hypothetical protein